MPLARNCSIDARSDARSCPTHVRCASAVTPFFCTSSATESVLREFEPPAPYVTLIKDGRRPAISRTICRVLESSLPCFGGKSSQETVTAFVFRISEILIGVALQIL